VGRQTLLNVFDDGVDIAKFQPFFGGQLKLPANALLGKKVDQRRCQALGCGVVERSLSKSRPNCGWSLH
jgi:hypothetical protein